MNGTRYLTDDTLARVPRARLIDLANALLDDPGQAGVVANALLAMAGR